MEMETSYLDIHRWEVWPNLVIFWDGQKVNRKVTGLFPLPMPTASLVQPQEISFQGQFIVEELKILTEE